jgi:hypothetical protein
VATIVGASLFAVAAATGPFGVGLGAASSVSVAFTRSMLRRERGGANAARSSASAATDGVRAAGDFSRHRRITRSSSFGAVAKCARNGTGGSAAMAANTAPEVSPENGVRPAISSCKTTPSDHTSARASTVRALRICSGAMYIGEPIVEPVAVR